MIDASGNVQAPVAGPAVPTAAVESHFSALPADSGVRLDAGGSVGVDVRRCPHCDKDVPCTNYDMHELRCARNAAYHKVKNIRIKIISVS